MITWKLIRREIRLIADDLFGEKVFGHTGWSDGSLYNSNRPNYIKVRLTNGSQIEAWNENVPVINGILISLSIDPDNPNLYRTRRVLSRYEEDFSFVANKFHKKNHTFPGPDTVPIEIRQVMGLHPSFSGFTASVRPGWIDGLDGNPEYFPGGSIDLVQYRPSTGSRYVLIYIDSLSTIKVEVGITKPLSELTVSDIPKLPDSAVFIASVRLYYPQQRIVDDFSTKNDVVDFRYRNVRFGRSDVKEAPVDGKLYSRSNLSWVEVIPKGGSAGQVLTKTSTSDFTSEWAEPEVSISDINRIDGDISSLNADIERIDGDISSLNADIERIDGDISSLNAYITPKLVPPGGSAGRILAKASEANYDLVWVVPPDGGGGGGGGETDVIMVQVFS